MLKIEGVRCMTLGLGCRLKHFLNIFHVAIFNTFLQPNFTINLFCILGSTGIFSSVSVSNPFKWQTADFLFL